MASEQIVDTSRSLRDKYAIIGVGETPYSRNSGRTTRHMGVEAVLNAMADCGIRADQVDGMMSYQIMDSTPSSVIAGDLGIRLDFHCDIIGGGGSIEALIGMAIGVIEAGMCETVAIFRSMNGATGRRMGGTGGGGGRRVGTGSLFGPIYGQVSPAEMFAHTFMRHMFEYGTTPEQVAHV